ncbi:MAG: hypothetical protein MR278_04755 [Bacteroidales bacterium]|nr:hypothetical protein [Anaerotignum sp.]MCI5679272.1 hypothetical protein [Bacteroidales bacterium]MDY3926152.1 hypothetical protein [Anaerotignum sp.]
MWWYISKLYDTDTEIVYAYGLETKEATGEIRYLKETKEFECVRLADGDSERGYDFFLPHLYRAITKEHAPDERQIAIG